MYFKFSPYLKDSRFHEENAGSFGAFLEIRTKDDKILQFLLFSPNKTQNMDEKGQFFSIYAIKYVCLTLPSSSGGWFSPPFYISRDNIFF